jgi:hypothetical protein
VEAHDKGWAVRREASTRVRSVHATKREAIKAGQRLAGSRGAELVIHGRDRRTRGTGARSDHEHE